MQEKLILITNDDGIDAPGIKHLIKIASKFGKVVVVCPNIERSGQSHSVTMTVPLRINKIKKSKKIEIYTSNGTPVDCIKLAMHCILDKKPDIILSGINHGANSSVNIFYSGTMGAVIEGCMLQIPSIGFSTCESNIRYDLNILNYDINIIIEKIINNGLPYNTCLNVNFPRKYNKDKGIKICRMGKAYWKEDFEERIDSSNNKYYWLKGTFVPLETSEDTDIWAIKNGYASLVPIVPDFTAINSIDNIKKLFKNV